MADKDQNPGHKWRKVENEGDGNRFFDSYRFTPFTTDEEFFRDPKIYETKVTRSTQDSDVETDSSDGMGPRGLHRTDEQIREEIDELLARHGQVDTSSIRVDVNDRIVTLSGITSSQWEKLTAEGIARNALGVMEVNNQLTVNTEQGNNEGRLQP